MEFIRKKILVIDDIESTPKFIHACLDKNKYDIIFRKSSYDMVDIIRTEKPNLLIVDLMLEIGYGIAVLKEVKTSPDLEHIGVFIFTGKILPQDYTYAIDNRADFYLPRFVSKEKFRIAVEQYFSGTLKIDPQYNLQQELDFIKNMNAMYEPPCTLTNPTQYIKLWGTRGSTAASGQNFVKYGGNTSCLEIKTYNPKERIIIDAGTGIRSLTEAILSSPEVDTIHLFISHHHWDHIIGFPFFAPVYIPKYTIHIYSPPGFKKSIKDIFKGMLEHDYFPVKLSDMLAKFVFHELDSGPIDLGHAKIDYIQAFQPGPCVAFKIHLENKTIGYATDNEFLIGYQGNPKEITPEHPLFDSYKPMIEFFKGCDILIHEAHHCPKEYTAKVGWGHSSIPNACVLAKYAKPKEWIVSNHPHSFDDQTLDKQFALHKAICADYGLNCELKMGFDGMVIPI